MKIMILAGGSGSRLWPVSRKLYPKQLLKLVDENNLFKKTVLRFAPMNAEYIVVTNDICGDYFKDMIEHDEDFSNLNIKLIIEPSGRDTAAAIALGLLKDSDDDDTDYLVTPADHFIKNENVFMDNISESLNITSKGYIVTFGIKPTGPETGYGYIKANTNEKFENKIYAVDSFKEKPDLNTAEDYVARGNYYWNSGMFVFKKKTMLEAMNRQCPDILNKIKEYLDVQEQNKQENLYNQIDKKSIDYAVMEKYDKIAVKPVDIGWRDIGGWKAVYEVYEKDVKGNVIEGDVVQFDCKNSFISSKDRLTAAIGVDNIVVISEHDALLVCDINKTNDVKKIYETLREKSRDEYQVHQTVFRPWGDYTVLEIGNKYKVKRILVKPGASLSLQLHHHRSEHWIVVNGTAKVTNAGEKILLTENESTYIPKCTKHRLENPGNQILEIIEVQNGDYLGEDDIVRFEDKYGRIK